MVDKPIYSIRRKRLRELIDSGFNKRQAEFARKVAKPASLIWQVLNGYKGFGETLARQIEARTGLPNGWLDRKLDAQPEEKARETLPPRMTPALVIHAMGIIAKAPALLEAVVGLAQYCEKRPSDCANVSHAIKLLIGEIELPSGVANNENRKVPAIAPRQSRTRR